MREHDGLIGRIRQIRRGNAEPSEPATPPTSDPGQDQSDPGQGQLHALETRITHLEQLVQGLQDSVHRESTRLSRRLGEVEARIQPAALGRALSDDQRERGL